MGQSRLTRPVPAQAWRRPLAPRVVIEPQPYIEVVCVLTGELGLMIYFEEIYRYWCRRLDISREGACA